MTSATLLLLMATAGTAATAATAATDDVADTWFLSGTRIYTAPDSPPIDDGVLVVRAGKIVEVGRRQDVPAPANASESECSGGVVAPGFQNSHVHFTGAEFRNADAVAAKKLQGAIQRMLTRYGYTTVVDTASDRDNTLALRSRIEAGEVLGPRILTVGNALFPVDGLPVYLADYPKALLDRMAQPDTPKSSRTVVRDNLVAGADGTKLFVATPQADGTIRRMTVPVAAAAARETHRRGKLVMAHPTDIEGIRTALAADVDILVHTTLGVEGAWPEALVRELAAQQVSVVPTFKLWHYELRKDGVPDDIQRQLVAATFEQLGGFIAAGGRVLFGTDVGYMGDFDPTEEYALMAEAGLTPMQILESLTTAPAARWNEGAQRGRLEPGMDADIVVLRVDPAQSPEAFSDVRCTFRKGQPLYTSIRR